MTGCTEKEKFVFISYAHKDWEKVMPIIESLHEKGFRVWFDKDIEAGSEWPEHIEDKVKQCETMLVFMSPSTVDSQNCRNEINLAFTLKKNILVVYLEETELRRGLALQLGTSQSIFWYEEPSEEIFFKRLASVKFLHSCYVKEDESDKRPKDDGDALDKTDDSAKRKQAAYEIYLKKYPIVEREEELKAWYDKSQKTSRSSLIVEFGVVVFFLLVFLALIYPGCLFVASADYSTVLGVIIIVVASALTLCMVRFLVKKIRSEIEDRRLNKEMEKAYEELMAVPPFVWEDEQA